MKKDYLQFGGSISKTESVVIGIIGACTIFLIWYLITLTGFISPGILPSPISVISTIPELVTKYNLFGNICQTITLNLAGYFLAVVTAIPIGFVIGIYPVANSLFGKYFQAARFIALPTVSGIFISIFGLGFSMKTCFLAFGIFIFALPSVIGKIEDLQNPKNEKDYVRIQTGKTLGMTNWQMLKYVYWPYVSERLYDDIRQLVAIAYTYVIYAESLNKVGGIGALTSTFIRQSRISEIYVLIVVIALIGFIQDRIFKKLTPYIFPHLK